MKFSENWIKELIKDYNNLELFSKSTLEINNIIKINKNNNIYKAIVGKILKIKTNINNIILYIDIGFKIIKKIYLNNKKYILKKNDKIIILCKKNNININYIIYSSNIINNREKNSIIKLNNSKFNIGENLINLIDINDNIIDIIIPHNRKDINSIYDIIKELNLIPPLKFNTIVSKNKLNIDSKLYNIYGFKIINNIYINNNYFTPIFIQERLIKSDIKIENNLIKNIANYIIIKYGYPIEILSLSDTEVKNICLKFDKNNILSFFNINNDLLSIVGLSNKNFSLNKIKNNILIICIEFKKDIIDNNINKYINKNKFIINLYKKKIDIDILNLIFEDFINIINLILNKSYNLNIDIINNNINRNFIILKKSTINKYFGFKINLNKLLEIFNKLNFKFYIKKKYYKIYPNINRIDIKKEEDIIEEILKCYEYNNIPIEYKYINNNYYINNIDKIKNFLIYSGYNEIISYSMINFNINIFKDKLIYIKNPISNDMSILRNSLIYGLIKTAKFNINRQQEYIKIFEHGVCFKYSNNNRIIEEQKISGLIYISDKFIYNYNIKKYNYNFNNLKGEIEIILNILNIYYNFKISSENELINGLDIIKKNKKLGYFGYIKDSILNHFNLNKYKIMIFEIKLLFLDKKKFNINNIYKFPINKRDLSILIKDNINIEELIDKCKLVDINIIDVFLIDIFKNLKLEKILTIRILIQGNKFTLSDIEINIIINKCILMLEKKFKIKINNV
ncbi:phenylalanine--tRNA ligase beta subunit [endosymbiont of Sipalinus gigas]|uniref:phenylalanine--tRNA ligase subunit beta-related protein n=1 Tax=endosymbiont of Sipalinus gigas TaxID=1972134 RepID=UPI000DC6EEB0|nr:hypothetical protein [endosymbiont of Sipalinus gigas]BBA85233.1 phenylalanine--tRNA ligase beta subunit [endosymbiont of Sipalinus gigas]